MVDADCLTRHLIDPVPVYAVLGLHLLNVAGDTVTILMTRLDLFGSRPASSIPVRW